MPRHFTPIITQFFSTILIAGLILVSGCSKVSDEVANLTISQGDQTNETDDNTKTDSTLSTEPIQHVADQQLARGDTTDNDRLTHHDWPQFRGANGLGVASTGGVPTTWSENENLIWKTKLPGAGTSSPIVIGDRIFLTCYHGYGAPGESSGDLEDLRLDIVSLQRQTGKILWTKSIKPDLP